MLDKLLEYSKRYEDLNAQLADPKTAQNAALFQKLAREVGDLRELIETGGRYRQARARCDEAEEIIAAGEDDELVELASAVKNTAYPQGSQ
jgi:peptide chain release factor 1